MAFIHCQKSAAFCTAFRASIPDFYRHFGKRLFDIVVSLLLIVLLMPIMIGAWLFLLFYNRGKVFFFQTRPGLYEKPFRIFKFRTMCEAFDRDGKPLPDAQRLTAGGIFLRKTSIDELPQLFNVLIGDMSLIGPRPLLTEYLPLYNERQRRRHNVKPGITGWSQVMVRNDAPWSIRFEYDIWYTEHVSLGLDSKILLMTFGMVVRQKGVTSPGEATVSPFAGNTNP